MKTAQIKVYVYLVHHIRASYEVVFESEQSCDTFISSLNADIDFVQIANEVIRRKIIKKVKIIYA